MESAPGQNRSSAGVPGNGEEALLKVMDIFPGICPRYLRQVSRLPIFTTPHTGGMVNHILATMEGGKDYPKAARSTGTRMSLEQLAGEADEDDVGAGSDLVKLLHTYGNGRMEGTVKSSGEMEICAEMILQDFPNMEKHDVLDHLHHNRNFLFPAYLAVEKSIRSLPNSPESEAGEDHRPSQNRLRHLLWNSAKKKGLGFDVIAPLPAEMLAARRICDFRRQNRARKSKQREEDAEAHNHGQVLECQCCFTEYPINRMVHCTLDEAHLFCIDCARRNAEVAVGSFRHEFGCLSLDQCPGGFSKTERRKFLDVKLTAALDRIEREAALRSAMIPNLESCSACDYAAVYPPVEENKVFVCENPLCGKVICRLCRMDSHLPLSCKEAKASLENSARKEIEESMSAALIRKCNKCGNPFIKSAGCNKMTCPRLRCRNMQCYICSQTCTYEHFGSGGRSSDGNVYCPLFDEVQDRDAQEVNRAGEEARKRLIQQK